MMQENANMNNEKKQYCKPLMEVVEMERQMDLLSCSGENCVGLKFVDYYEDSDSESSDE